MLRRIRTELIFAVAALAGLLSLAAITKVGMQSLPFVVLAHGLLIWSIVKSETDGFIETHGMPRAGDPQREFHPLQAFILFLIALAQLAMAAYLVLTTS